MKISVDVDCTPEEARRFMGLPDLSPVHEAYVEKMKRNVDEGVSSDTLTSLMQSWAPMGEVGMNMWKQVFEQLSRSGAPRK